MPALTDAQLEQFIDHGYVRLDEAFPRAVAAACCTTLWRDTGCDPHDPRTWTRPAIRLGMYATPPFLAAAQTPRLHQAFDQLVGPGRWLPCRALGTFRCAFPSEADPGDAGWHVDVSFGLESPDFLEWRANVSSRGRSLLMLFLFTDVGEDDAPTRLRVGSHHDVARQLAPAGDAGLTLRELTAGDCASSAHRPETRATGDAGTVYLCHPFLVHAAARAHRGTRPRFLAQPPLFPSPAGALDVVAGTTPVEVAIRRGVGAG